MVAKRAQTLLLVKSLQTRKMSQHNQTDCKYTDNHRSAVVKGRLKYDGQSRRTYLECLCVRRKHLYELVCVFTKLC